MALALLWVQNLLGSGHLGRAQLLAAGLAESGFEVILVNGGRALPWLVHANVCRIDLPSVSAADPSFSRLVDVDGRSVDAGFWADRRQRLLELFERAAPAVVVTEMFPFGRRAFRDELIPLLRLARAAGALRVASVRDVLVEGTAAKHRWMRDVAIEHYDLVLAHTDPSLIPFGLTFPYAEQLGERLVETGYVAPPRVPPATAEGRGEVLVSAGGGRVGRALLETALEARRLACAPHPWRLIAADETHARALARRAGPSLVVDRPRSDFRELMANSLLSISQAGYNTVVEAIVHEKSMVLVPFGSEGETEQRTRADRLAACGFATVLDEAGLTPAALARAVDRTLGGGSAARPPIDLDGVRRSADLISGRLRARPGG